MGGSVNKNSKAPLRAWSALCLALSPVICAADESASQAKVDKSVVSSAQDQNVSTEHALPEIEIKATSEEQSYTVPNASTGTKTDTPLIETPIAVQVVPAATLEDRQTINLADVYKNVSGMQADYGFSNWDAAFLRGFSSMEGNQNAASYRNGVRTYGRGGGLEEMSNIERIEVAKGPAAMLYGRIEPGGLINVVTRQPEATPSYFVQQQAGSWDFYRTTVDATGPVNKNRAVLYRFDAALQSSQSFRDVLFADYNFLAPSLSIRPSSDLMINLNAERRRAEGPGDYGAPLLTPGVSRTLWMGDSKENAWLDKDRLALDWSYRINPDWQVRNGFDHYHGKTRYNSLYAVYSSFDSATGNVDLAPWIGTNTVDAHSAFLELNGHIDSAGLKHTLLFGADTVHSDTSLDYYTNGFAALYTFNVFTPNNNFADFATLDTLSHDFLQAWQERWHGVYVQDQIAMGNWRVLAGGRYDWTWTNTTGTYVDPAQPANKHSGFTPRVGVLYLISPEWSTYASYSRALGSLNPGVDANGNTFQPEMAKQIEAGMKLEKGNFNATAAVYRIVKSNVISPDPSGLVFANVASGEVRSQGFEFDATMHLDAHWDALANYAYTDAEVTRDDNGYQGMHPANVAKNLANFWVKYSPDDHWAFGGGMNWVGDRYGDSFNTFKLPEYALADAMMAYHFKWGRSAATAQLNVNNLFSRKYLASTVRQDTTPELNILPGAPRSFVASIKADF